MLTVKNLKTEYISNPIGVALQGVRFSWQTDCDKRNQYQAAYQILVKDGEETAWDSGKVFCADTSGILYQGKPLRPRTKYLWQVKIFTNSGEESPFSALHSFETTLSALEWESAPFIGANTKGLPLLRKSFCLPDKTVVSGRVYVCGLGKYELSLNGNAVAKDLLNPLITRYHNRYLYNVYDVTALLQKGKNAFGVLLGNGYYAMHGNGVDWQKDKWANAPWADRPKCKLLCYIVYDDGTETLIATDESWKCAQSPLLVDEAYYGEEQDAGLQINGWNSAEFDDEAWQNAVRVAPPAGKAEPQLAESCSVIKTMPLKLLRCKENEYLFDVGQMTVGWVKLTLSGNCGDKAEVSYSEWLDENGNFDEKWLLSVWDFEGKKRHGQTDYFILNGDATETLVPHFQYKGFRYVRIRFAGDIKLENITAETVYADIAQTGKFACSDPFINRLHNACKNALSNNLHDYPSDTPVYEKMGYLADGYLTQEMAFYNFDAVKYYEKWARDIIDQAKDDGYIEQTAPMWDEDKENAPEWSVAIAVVPYQIYKLTGDKALLLECYEKAKKVFAYQIRLTDGFIATSMWGDHACNKDTIKRISATTALFYMANILAETAKLKNNLAEYEQYLATAKRMKSAFNARFFDENKGFYCENAGGGFALNAQVLPYAFGLVEDEKKALVESSIREYGQSLEGGIFAVKQLFPVLTDLGLEERLYDWVTANTPPSFGYWLSFGDESLWEQWFDFTRSRNHHMFGTVDEWLYKALAGLEITGGNALKIQPCFAKKLQWAKASVAINGGEAVCEWERKENATTLHLEIPFNTHATARLVKEKSARVYVNGADIASSKDIRLISNSDKEVVFEMGCGSYDFEMK